MRILTVDAMREVDRRAIEELGIPGMVLMENAALGVVDAVGEVYPEVGSAAIFCGPGNNGGDGLAIARHLCVRGYEVEVFLATGGRELRGDACSQLAIHRAMDLPLREIAEGDDLDPLLEVARGCDVVIDALFGTGLARPLEGTFAELVEGINDLPAPRVAVDLPSGLNGDRAEPLGPHVRADLTVTFAALKAAHVLSPAAEACVDLVVADLGIPSSLIAEAAEAAEAGAAGAGLHLLVGEELAGELPPREAGTHKGSYGHALILAGSPGKAGAAILAARAAVRSGAGLVTAAVPEPILHTVDLGSIESMTLPLRADAQGHLAAQAAERVLDAAQGKDVLALGPGLGQEDGTVEAIRRIVRDCPLPLVLDADGINAFAGRADDLAGRAAETVITPHPGELGRLLGLSTAEVQADRLAAVRQAASRTGAIVVLKGHRTLVAVPGEGGGEVYVNPTGNPGMATGGTGDVLTGMIAGLLAQGQAGYGPGAAGALGAVLLAVYLHGLAGDLAAARLGAAGLAAGDLLESLPAAFARLAAAP